MADAGQHEEATTGSWEIRGGFRSGRPSGRAGRDGGVDDARAARVGEVRRSDGRRTRALGRSLAFRWYRGHRCGDRRMRVGPRYFIPEARTAAPRSPNHPRVRIELRDPFVPGTRFLPGEPLSATCPTGELLGGNLRIPGHPD
ncbi:MAG: hypothetical protein LVQ64_05765 [Thermoplasmatales archaeon]|nr:hypothetical protein [Thermoplasmatales archaeon]